jgi:hypothetical protein
VKILVNVGRRTFSEDWQECQAVKFVEQPDGSFDVMVTRDIGRSREIERKRTEAEDAIRGGAVS